MQKVSIRLPYHVVEAYDSADGTRSAVMRRRLIEAVEEGEVDGVPDDLRTLSAREGIVDRGQLNRKRGKFREEAHEFFGCRWEGGATPPNDMDVLAETWRNEAALYGSEYLTFVEAMMTWFTENWSYEGSRPEFPPARSFVRWSDDEEPDVEGRLVEVMEQAQEDDIPRTEAVRRVSMFHPDERVHDAAQAVFGEQSGGQA